MVVASIGRKVFAWRAGAGKGKHGGKEGKKGGIGKCEGRGGTRGIGRSPFRICQNGQNVFPRVLIVLY